MGVSGRILAYLGVSRRIWAYLSVSGRLWAYLGVSGRIWAYLGISSHIWAYLGVSGRIMAYPGVSGRIWAYLSEYTRFGATWPSVPPLPGPTWIPEMIPKWLQNGAPNYKEKGSRKQPKTIPKWSQNGSQNAPKWLPNGFLVGVRLDGPFIAPFIGFLVSF